MANIRGQNGSFMVLFKDDSRKEIFLVFRTDYPVWALTGGGIEPDESPKQAAIRESYEETGFVSQVRKQVGKYEFPNKTTYLFEGQYVSGIYKPEYEGNIGKWFFIEHLPSDITSSTRQKIYDTLHHQGYPFTKTIANEIPLHKNIRLILMHPWVFVTFVKKQLKRQQN
jgi:8-oxo-dGTP pyrophosphatase MutT (NUDIX family)